MTLRGKSDPDWSALVEKWKAEQLRLRQRMMLAPLKPLPRFVAGADCAFSDDKQTIFAAAIIYDRETERIIEGLPTPPDRRNSPMFPAFSVSGKVRR